MNQIKRACGRMDDCLKEGVVISPGCFRDASLPLALPSVSPELRAVYLKPGELLVTHDPTQVTTVLGSCVAVTMFSPRLRFAAICHAMLPEPKDDRLRATKDHPERFKYLSEAIPFMAERFRMLGIVSHEVEVKVFGGGNVLGLEESDQRRKLVGNVNIDIAQAILKAESLSIKAGNVGGEVGRKILFNTQTGEVLHRFL